MDIQEKPIIQFVCKSDKKIYIPVFAKNGDNVANVIALFDTGSELTIISKELYNALELKNIGYGKIQSVGGNVNAVTSNIEIAFSDNNSIISEFQEIICCSMSLNSDNVNIDEFCDIILGTNFLKKYKWLLSPNENNSFTLSVYLLN